MRYAGESCSGCRSRLGVVHASTGCGEACMCVALLRRHVMSRAAKRVCVCEVLVALVGGIREGRVFLCACMVQQGKDSVGVVSTVPVLCLLSLSSVHMRKCPA